MSTRPLWQQARQRCLLSSPILAVCSPCDLDCKELSGVFQ